MYIYMHVIQPKKKKIYACNTTKKIKKTHAGASSGGLRFSKDTKSIRAALVAYPGYAGMNIRGCEGLNIRGTRG